MANPSVAVEHVGDRWLSVDDIAAYLGVKRDTVYKWIERRGLPAHKVGRLWKFRKHEVDQWVLSHNDQALRKTEKNSHDLSHGGR